MPLEPTIETIPRRGRGTGSGMTAGADPASWLTYEEHFLAGETTTWLSLRSTHGVHTRPVFAAWTGSSFVHASNPSAVKTRYLAEGQQCSLGLELPGTHLVIEAVPTRLLIPADLERAVVAFSEVYDWPTTVSGDLLEAPYAAPTSGGPPFQVYELAPVRAHAFPTDDAFAPTRFLFEDR